MMVNFLADPLRCRVQSIVEAVPDKETIHEECLDDYPEKVLLDELIRDGAELEDVRQQAERCKNELDQTVAKYQEEYLVRRNARLLRIPKGA